MTLKTKPKDSSYGYGFKAFRKQKTGVDSSKKSSKGNKSVKEKKTSKSIKSFKSYGKQTTYEFITDKD